MTEPQKDTRLHRVVDTQVLRACVRSDVPPFGYFLSRRLVGFDISLVMHLTRRLSTYYKRNITIEWTVITAGARISSLQRDSCDIVAAAFTYTPSRAKLVSFSKVYIKTGKVLVSAKKITRKKPIIAVVSGTTLANVKAIQALKGTMRLFNNYKEIIHAMEGREVDYVVTDRPIALHMVRSVTSSFEIMKSIGQQEEYAIGVAKGHKALLKIINTALEDMAQTGLLAYLQRQWL